ncbi:hypothetical protein BCR32DRAFT_306064 [Anaeromyces robustus]|uniref:Right handed beta helix domain-containing protein n=1 Tax=Anaeromyces robustus TaxID=1754192 RepID=A0A1Y1VWY4_9FUNG|nr:hypothetical protein BCR32DRAFT_306064 [Anaeromyces robustus]|eukprot:ORX65790.1 hypothetical protein BCR32DRAFT_306064 [Anaeromyces robustus]
MRCYRWKIHFQLLFLYIFCSICSNLLITKSLAEVLIKLNNDKNTMEDLGNSISKILSTSKDNEVQIELGEKNYNIAPNGINNFYLYSSLTFYSNNGTIFNFQNDHNSRLYFEMVSGISDIHIKFQNITFYNFSNSDDTQFDMFIFNSFEDTDRFQIEFENCIFKNIQSNILNFLVSCKKSTQTKPQIIINNCQFINSHKVFITYHFTRYYNNIVTPNCFNLFFKNSTFQDIQSVGRDYYGDITMEDCEYYNHFN